MLFGRDESLIPVLDYSSLASEQAHYFAFTSVFPPAVTENERRRWMRSVGHDRLCIRRGFRLIGGSQGGYLHRCLKKRHVRAEATGG